MNRTEEINSIVNEMIDIINKGSSHKIWIKILEETRNNLIDNFKLNRTEAIRLYGGIGSLNDIVLHVDRIPMIKENNEFDLLRSKLYNILKYSKY